MVYASLLVQPPPLEPAQQDVVDGDVDELDEEADEAHDEEAHGGGVRYPLELCCLLCVVAWRFMVRRWVRRWEGAARVRSTQHTAALAMHAIIDPRTFRAAQARCPALTRCPHAHVHVPLRSGLVHFLTRCRLSLANFLRGWMMCAFTSDIVPACFSGARGGACGGGALVNVCLCAASSKAKGGLNDECPIVVIASTRLRRPSVKAGAAQQPAAAGADRASID